MESHNPIGANRHYETRDALVAELFTGLARTLASCHFTSLLKDRRLNKKHLMVVVRYSLSCW